MIEGRLIPADRVGCLIAGCGRTFKRTVHDSDEVICAKHYRMAPAALRAELIIRRRRLKRLDTDEAYRHSIRQWVRVREAAVDAAAGNINPADLEQFLKMI